MNSIFAPRVYGANEVQSQTSQFRMEALIHCVAFPCHGKIDACGRNRGISGVLHCADYRLEFLSRYGLPRRATRSRGLQPIKKTRLTLNSTYWPPATRRPNAPPNPTVCDSAVEAPDSRGRIGNCSSESLDFGSRGRSSRPRCSKTEP